MMVSSSHKTLLVACFATACLLPSLQSLSIPPTPKVQQFRTIPSKGDLTTTAVPTEDANNGLGDDLVDRREQNDDIPAQEQSGGGMRKDSEQERDTTTVSPLELTPKASSSDTDDDDTDEPETTTISDDIDSPTGTDLPAPKLQPVFEVIDIVLRPFRPPAVMVLDFFRKPSNATGSSSEDEDSKPVSSSSSVENRSESNENEGSAPASASPSGTRVGTSSNENSGEKKIGPHKALPDSEIIRTPSTPSPSALNNVPNGDSPMTGERSVPSSNKRTRRETNQTGNNSNMGDDETSGKGKFHQDDDSMTSSTTKKSPNVGNDDTPINADISVDDDDNDDKDSGNNGENKTDGNKSGTVKIFLEILQLVPLSNSSISSSSSPPPLSSMGGESSPSITSTPRGESAEADPNQKISPANPSAQTTSFEGWKRAARSVTSKAAAEEKSNPSSSPTASTPPSSGTTKKTTD